MEEPLILRFIVVSLQGRVVLDERFTVTSDEALEKRQEELNKKYSGPMYDIIMTNQLEAPAKKIIKASF